MLLPWAVFGFNGVDVVEIVFFFFLFFLEVGFGALIVVG